ncbi:uncharacterized protein TNCV_4576521 [Trichonephila clavipes]|nr:uncharacterized protein TNCV_4576521 [Trichonephila clavipes]
MRTQSSKCVVICHNKIETYRWELFAIIYHENFVTATSCETKGLTVFHRMARQSLACTAARYYLRKIVYVRLFPLTGRLFSAWTDITFGDYLKVYQKTPRCFNACRSMLRLSRKPFSKNKTTLSHCYDVRHGNRTTRWYAEAQKTSLPKSNDEHIPDYGRMNPFELCNAMETQLSQQSPDRNQKRDRKTAQGNDKRRKQKEPKKSEKEFPDLTDDDALVGYQKDHDELSSLKEHKLGELALFLPCPVLDCPENTNNSIKLNDPPETNAKKHSRQASYDSKKIANPNTDGGFTSPKKVAKKLKLSDPIAGTSQPISVKNKFSSLAGKEAEVTPPTLNQTMASVAARPKVPPIMFKYKKENYKAIIKDLNKDFPNCGVKLAGIYLKIFTTSTDEHRIVTIYLEEKCEEFYVINPPDSRPQKIVIKGLSVSTEIGEIQADLTSQGFCVVKVAQLTRSKTKSLLPIFMVELERNPDSPDIFHLKKCCYLAVTGRHF